jgi:hypothetical protein
MSRNSITSEQMWGADQDLMLRHSVRLTKWTPFDSINPDQHDSFDSDYIKRL